MDAGSRSAASHAARTRSSWVRLVSRSENPTLNSSANRAASAGVRFGPWPPTMIGTAGVPFRPVCTGLGSPGRAVERSSGSRRS